MMYSFNVTQQLIVFLQSFALGMLLGFLYSLIYFFCGFFLKPVRRRKMFSDIVISFFGAFSVFCFLLAFNLGRLRIFISAGIVGGILIFRLSFGQTLDFLLGKLLYTLKYIVRLICAPIISIIGKNNEKICKKTHKKSSQRIAKKNKNVV